MSTLLTTSFVMAAMFITTSQAEMGKDKPGDRLCRFYSSMTKKCQSNCVNLSAKEMESIVAKRGVSTTTTVSMAEINSPTLDPILFIRCSDQPRISPWTASQGFVAFTPAAPGSAYEKADVYVGACFFQNDKRHSWSSRGCDRPLTDENGQEIIPVQDFCFIGGEDQYKNFYPSGWQQAGDDEGTLKVFHDE